MSYPTKVVAVGILTVCFASCDKHGSSPKADFTTPQGAVLMWNEACHRRDVEAIVAVMSFRHEAILLLKRTAPDTSGNERAITETAQALESAFRQQVKENGIPDRLDFESTFPFAVPYGEGVVVVTEKRVYEDGHEETEDLVIANTDDGWRFLFPLNTLNKVN